MGFTALSNGEFFAALVADSGGGGRSGLDRGLLQPQRREHGAL